MLKRTRFFAPMISIWEKETFLKDQDIIIIGSGFTGLWTAFFLKQKNPKLEITILERGWLPTGASTRNAGFACFGSLSEVMADANNHGHERMLELVELRFKGLKTITKHFKKDIDFDLCGGYELYDTSNAITTDQLEENVVYLNSLLRPITGKKRTYIIDEPAFKKFGFARTKTLVKSELEGCLHSGKLVQCLMKAVLGMGVQILPGTEATGFQPENEMIRITTAKAEFRSRSLVICTNAFASELIDADVIPARGQVLLTSPIADLPFKGTFHADEGYYYFRNLGKRVLLGGARNKAFEEETTKKMETTHLIQQELERYLSEVILPSFDGKYTIDMRWAGIMGMGAEKLPIIRELQTGVFCGVRMSGMGVALAPMVAQKLTKMVLATL